MLKILTKLLFPVECANCKVEGKWLCDSCRSHLLPSSAVRCRLCHRVQLTGSGLCKNCQRSTGLDGVVSLFKDTETAVIKLIKAGKYFNQADALRFLSATYRTKLLRLLPDEEWTFSFVPLTRSRFAERGFNQAELIARIIAGSDFSIQNLFKKTWATKNQAELSVRKRQTNLRKAFTVARQAPAQLVICDDMIVTGTTLSRLAKLAKRKGAKQVWALTLTHS